MNTENAENTAKIDSMNRTHISLTLLLLLAALLAGLSASPVSAGNRTIEPVGEVSLLLGEAWIEHPERDRQPVKTGQAIRSTDRIVTESNGHVHVRFIDRGLVSVRPDSRLEITEYIYNAEHPEQSVVRFNLLEGVARSISGDAASSARQSFRLDTPIAAIGVRGTDFEVSATASDVRARVNQGAIVMAPYSDTCISGSLGPCDAGAVELASNTMQIFELVEGQVQSVARIGPEQNLLDEIVEDEEADERQRADEDRSAIAAAESMDDGDVYQETQVLREVDERATGRPLEDRQLAWARQTGWGHWGTSAATPGDGIVMSREDAREGRGDPVGNDRYVLFRSAGDGQLNHAGRIGFALQGASARHHGSAGVETMEVLDGSLNIDFDRRHFSTRLELDSAATGDIIFSDSGTVDTAGFFNNRRDGKNVAGSVSADGREAGYFFDQRLDSGEIEGITLWGAGK